MKSKRQSISLLFEDVEVGDDFEVDGRMFRKMSEIAGEALVPRYSVNFSSNDVVSTKVNDRAQSSIS